jgi:carbon-monoxide dehydrogenase small subunit
MSRLNVTINGQAVEAFIEPRMHLGDFLREQRRLTGTHLGCEHGVCGACTVLLDGAPVRSCITYAVACEGREVRTIEDFEDDLLMADLRKAFSREHGLQCGFCTPGMLITSRDICLRKPHAAEPEIRTELSGNLCRCTGYVGIVNAIKEVLSDRRADVPAEVKRPLRVTGAIAAFTPVKTPSVDAPATFLRDDVVFGETAAAGPGAMRIDESVVVRAPASSVWQVLSDIPTTAACLPGAEVIEFNDHSVKGRVQIKFGPMSAAFSGAATVVRDDQKMMGTVRGAGVDGLSKTRARGELIYRVVPIVGDSEARIAVALTYSLVGPLAQFSRSGLVKDFAHRLIAEFAANLNERIAKPEAPLRKAELRVGALVVSVLWQRLKRLFGFDI